MENSSSLVIKIGSRESVLALKQTNHVRGLLEKLHRATCEVESMKTIGDKILDVALSKIGSKSLFTRELEEALYQKCFHIVVHSLKDLPTSLPDGLVIGAVLKREDPRDAVLMHPRHKGLRLSMLPSGAVVGSSSVRRIAQLKRNLPTLNFASVRGNLNTRLRKLEEGEQYDALILAAAGLHRMQWKDKIAQYLESHECMYAVGQGALAVECLLDDIKTQRLLQPLIDTDTLLAVIAERQLMATLEGGCSAPVAVHSQVTENNITLRGGVWSLDGLEQLNKELTLPLPHSWATDGEAFEIVGSSSNGTLSTGDVKASTKRRLANSDTHLEKKKQKTEGTQQVFCGILCPSHLAPLAEVAQSLGLKLAKMMLDSGAGEILKKAKEHNAVVAPNTKPTQSMRQVMIETAGTAINNSL